MKLYLVQSGIYSKLGITQDWSKRFHTLQTGNPHPMTLLKLWDLSSFPPQLTRDLEKRIHNQLKAFNHRGEWFIFPDPLLEFLQEIPASDLVNNYRVFDPFLMRKK